MANNFFAWSQDTESGNASRLLIFSSVPILELDSVAKIAYVYC